MYRVLVTGVGALIGYGIEQSLKECNFPLKIFGMDLLPDAVGKKWCDIFIKAVPLSSPRYTEFLRETIQKHNIDLVIPGFEADTLKIAENLKHFDDIKTKFVVDRLDLLETANNKWLTHQALIEYNITEIPSCIEGKFSELEKTLGLPFLVKPMQSHASRDISTISSEVEFDYWKQKLGDNFLAQQIVGNMDEEYTAAVFGYGDGTCSQSIVFQRWLGRDGATWNAKTVILPELDEMIFRIVSSFKPEGPANFQFRYHERKYYLLEINARISSTTSMRTAFGYNEAEMCIEYYLMNRKPEERKLKQGTAKRYLKDMVVYDSDHI